MTTLSLEAVSTVRSSAYRKTAWRLMPFLMLCYLCAYLDRVNVGFAKLQMMNDLALSETVYGLGAGMFFIGYFLCEVPSNIILHKVGARVWIARIMITWGIVSALFAFVETAWQFYALRFLLGIAEAGLAPGLLLYLTYWFPSYRRARMTVLWFIAIPLSGMVGGPISGWIMNHFAGMHGWAGWQWMFVLEAIPAALMGVAVLFYLDNSIRAAKWLTEDEKVILEQRIATEAQGKVSHPSIRAMFADPRIWVMALIYFCCVMGQYSLTFWLPSLIKAAGVTGVLNIGLFTAIPYSVAVASMILLGRSSDKYRERRWHMAIPLVVGAAAIVCSALAGAHNTGWAIFFLTIAAGGILAASPMFWSLPTAFLGGVSAAAGIAAINSVGNLAGFAAPYMIGSIKDLTQSTDIAIYLLAGILVIGAAIIMRVPAKLVNK